MALAIVTCMDNRLPTGGSMGLGPGEAFLVRNAGGRVTGDVLRSLTVACSALDVGRIAVVHHTDCRALAVDDGEMRRRLTGQLGSDPGRRAFLGHPDLAESVRVDVAAVEQCPTLPRGVEVEGYIYDVGTHHLRPVLSVAPTGGGGRSVPSGYRSSDGLPG